MPIIISKVPKCNKHLLAENIMARNLVTLDSVSKMTDIEKALDSGHH